jgi:hypothetical protein
MPSKHNHYSPSAQASRRAELLGLIRTRLRPLLNEKADAPYLLWWDQPRVELWASSAFFAGGPEDIAFGNTIVRHVRDALGHTPGPGPFEASASASLLAEHGDRLEPDVRDFLVHVLVGNCECARTADFQFHGYNDNMPTMWTWAQLYAGENFDRPDLLRIAHANLRQLQDLLRRRGAVSEYGMGYSTHRQGGLARIAEFSRDAEIRQLARDLEARVWAEIAGHWHPGLGEVVGASMRGGAPINSEMHALFIQIFGREIERPWMPQESHWGTRAAVVDMGLDPDKYIFAYPFAFSAEFASATYHVPDEVAALFYRKAMPFRFACTAENGYVNEGIYCKQIPVYGQGGILITTKLTDEVVEIEDCPQHGAQPHQITTWHGRHFGLGTSTTNMFTTSHALRCSYRRRETPRGLEDMGALCLRYNINGKVPGGLLPNLYPKSPDDQPQPAGNYCQLYRDMGRHFCLQHEHTVLCLSTPDYREYWGVKEMRLDLLLLQEAGKVRRWEIAGDGSRIDIDEGAVYFSIRPLIGRWLLDGAGGTAPSTERLEGRVPPRPAPRVREINEWLVVSLYNYEGPSRRFGKREIAKLGNGFILEVRDAEEFADFASFQAQMAEARVLDQLYGGRRRVHYARPGLRLSTHYCPYMHTVMQASVNGVEKPWEKLSFSNGIEKTLPFMDDKPAPGFEDWGWIETQMTRPVETYNPRE